MTWSDLQVRLQSEKCRVRNNFATFYAKKREEGVYICIDTYVYTYIHTHIFAKRKVRRVYKN